MMIPLMNVSRQYAGIKDEADRAILDVLASGQYIMGENVKAFEHEFADYCGVSEAVAVGNGTDALVIALQSLGIGEGDEVITSAMSFFATAEAISAIGAKPVFVDVRKDKPVIDEALIEGAVTHRTKAIVAVHLYGECAEMDAINEIAKRHSLYVVEDAAQAAGAEYKGRKAGSLGDVSCFSFFPTKNLGCAGDGGIILTDNLDVARAARAYRVHGSGLDGEYTYNRLNRIEKAPQTDFHGNQPKYYNFLIGHNSRMDEIQAALLRIKLRYLDKWNRDRVDLAQRYCAGIKNNLVKLPVLHDGQIHYVFVLMAEKRETLKAYLQEKGIGTGTYFPVPLHLQQVYKELGYKAGDMPNAENLAGNSLAIPMFAELTAEEQNSVIEAINSFRG